MNKWLHLLFWIVILFTISYSLICFAGFSFGQFSSPAFLFNYLGVLLGFALTLYTFIISQYDSITEKIDHKYKDDVTNVKKKQILKNVFTEVGDDVYLIFIALIVVIIALVIETPLLGKFEIIVDFFNSIMFTIFALSILAIRDLILVAFRIGDLLVTENNKSADN